MAKKAKKKAAKKKVAKKTKARKTTLSKAEKTKKAREFVAEALTGVDREERDAKIRLNHNKKNIFAALKRHNITRVDIQWTGSGDSGGIEDTTVAMNDGSTLEKVPTEAISVYREKGSYDSVGGSFKFKSKLELEESTLADALEGMVYDWLQAHHGGWENNEGGDGEASFDVKEDLIHITHRTNVMTHETDEDEL